MRSPKRLSAAFVRTINRPGRYGEGHGGYGLSLLVKERSGGGLAKSWSQRLRVSSKPSNLGLGRYPIVTLAEARAKALENARAVDQGRDPRERSRIPTFEQAAEKVIRLYELTWRTGGRAASAEVWRSSLKRYVFPKLGRKPVSDITTADVLGVIVPIWHAKTATARRVKGRISSIMRWAIAQNYIENNPASDAVEAALPRDTTPQQHHRALPHREVGTALRTVRESNASPAAKLLFAFVTQTASRSGEARLARWSEVDLEERVWTVPADRMKAKREHRVPLASRAMEVLTEARRLADDSGLIFPSPTGRGPLGANTLTKLCHELRLGCTPHGMRSSFRTWCGETEQPRELAEQALAHVNPNRVEAAYMRSDLFERRRELMEAWSDYLLQPNAQLRVDSSRCGM